MRSAVTFSNLRVLWSLLTMGLAVLGLCLTLSALPRQEEADDYYQRWLTGDVLYIISDEERQVFLSLSTNEEREHFIEQFWRRRDPDPRTTVNEFKEEHYRRIAYANEKFPSGIPGWKTDRGMIYIKFGEPDRIESHATGGFYQRSSWEGGGSTSTFPFERWEYRFIEGVGQDIEIEFVDTTMSGEYRLTIDPDEKDAFLRTAGLGLTTAEMLGRVAPKVDRIVKKTSPMPWTNPLVAGSGRFKDQPFERLQLLTDLQKAPSIEFADLKARVESRIYFDDIPFQLHYDVFRLDARQRRVIITAYLNSKNLSFEQEKQIREFRIGFYAEVTGISGQTVETIEDTLVAQFSEAVYQSEAGEVLVYQRPVILPAGRYKLNLYIKDLCGDQIGSATSLLVVPDFESREPTLSSIVIARKLQVPSVAAPGEPQFKIWPAVGGKLPLELGAIGLYYEVYNAQIDQSTQRPQIEVTYELVSRTGEVHFPAQGLQNTEHAPQRIGILVVLQTTGLTKGTYSLKIKAEDRISGKHCDTVVPLVLS